jgi:hypothetical protein
MICENSNIKVELHQYLRFYLSFKRVNDTNERINKQMELYMAI